MPGVSLPAELMQAQKPLIVGLTNDPERLIHLRRNRLSMLDHNEATDYTDIEAVRAEVREARRLFAERHRPVIDVTRRSIEETASSIYKLLMRGSGPTPEPIVLASASTARAAVLRAAGVEFATEPAGIDETPTKRETVCRRRVGDRLCDGE